MFLKLFLLAEAAPKPPPGSLSRWLTDPRHSVLIVLVLAIVIGGGRKWLEARRAGRLKERLQGAEPSVEEILEASRYGREALPELFSLLDPATAPQRRQAAARSLASLWAQDQLVAEEERALVVRGFQVDWRARRRYPRSLSVPIPISVRFGLPFLKTDDDSEEKRISQQQLEWSCRIAGSERASLETFSEWQAGRTEMSFDLNPQDFSGPGPHRLVFQARVRTRLMSSSWELDLPHIPLVIEFDPALDVEALKSLPDDETGRQVRQSIRLIEAPEGTEARFLPIHRDLVIRNPPVLEVDPRPCDLAHNLTVEFEGIGSTLPAGWLVVTADQARKLVPLQFEGSLPESALDRTGEYRLRVKLSPDTHRGWADPDVRSVWPETIETEWVSVHIIRS
ncbi:MAG TPA: hypothetical protein VFT74_12335 [Isosphaeraceae bacterium]|nr:hypothetical protein [Isosphaeraceae bacterium]